MNIAALLLAFAVGFPDEGGEFYQDFRGQEFDRKSFKFTGPNAAELSKTELEGLRISIPADQEKPSTVGLITTFPVKGDFEITVGYELLQADRPKTGNGVGFELYISSMTPTGEAIAFYRMARANEGDVYQCSRMSGPAGKRQSRHSFTPTDSKSGQLRLKRTNEMVAFLVREGADGEFRQVHQYYFGPENLRAVWLRAFQGGSRDPVDILLKDVRIGQTAPKGQEVSKGEPAAEPAKGGDPATNEGAPRGKLIWLLAGLAGAGLILGGLFAWWRSSRATNQMPRAVARKKPKPVDD